MDTLALDTNLWDLDVDAAGNWRTVGNGSQLHGPTDATGPGMRLAQDVATRCMAWRGEVPFDTTQGIRYPNILGQAPNLTVVQNAFQQEALNVPGCAQAVASFTFDSVKRMVTGTLNVADFAGNTGSLVV
ncbi:baseplate wedge subunit [Ralstonia phage PQ43W]